MLQFHGGGGLLLKKIVFSPKERILSIKSSPFWEVSSSRAANKKSYKLIPFVQTAKNVVEVYTFTLKRHNEGYDALRSKGELSR